MRSNQHGVSASKRSKSPDTSALILSYHKVNDPKVDTWALSVSPERFFEQMRALRAVAEPCTLTDIAVGLLRGDLPHNAVAVTFDDGYLNNLLNAKPILEKFEIPATVFVCAGWVGRDDELWWDQLERALLLTMELPNQLELNVDGQHFEWNVLPGRDGGSTQAPRIQFTVDDLPSRHKFYHDVWEAIRRMPPDSQIEAMQKISAWSGIRPDARHDSYPMNAQELADITAGGLIEIGAHTVSHPLLPAHSSGFQRHEILNGKSQLERILGIPIYAFAYPYGEYDHASLDTVREAEFLCACTTVQNICTVGTSVYELPRVTIKNWGGQEFANIVVNRMGLREQKSADFLKREFQTRSSVLQTKAPEFQLTEPTISAGTETDIPKVVSTPKVSFGDLSGPLPLSDDWGFSRGTPIDRFFIERFLARHQGDIGGHVLEVKDDTYTRRFGAHRVSASDVLDVRADNSRASIIADLQTATSIPSDSFDCLILTQVLDEIDDVEAALGTVLRVLKPGGVALITVPGISQISSNPEEASKWSRSFYPRTLQQLLAKFFDPKTLIVEGFGNLKTTIGFLAGLAQEDLAKDDFLLQDQRYPLTVAARATKPGHCMEASLEARSAESARLKAELADARYRITELECALEAQARQLELKRRQEDARRRRTEDLEAALEFRSAEVASLSVQLTDASHRIVELRSALGAEVIQLQSVKMSTSWKLTLPLRRFAEKFPWSARQLRRVLKLFWEALTFQLGSRVRSRIRRNLNGRLLVSSKLFDRDWYLGQYPDVRVGDIDPVLHYLEHGASEGRNPSALFDSNWYLQQNTDVRNAGINPLVHYLKHGAAEGRRHCP